MHADADAKGWLAGPPRDLTATHVGIEPRQNLLSQSIHALLQLLSRTRRKAWILGKIFEPAWNGTLGQQVVLERTQHIDEHPKRVKVLRTLCTAQQQRAPAGHIAPSMTANRAAVKQVRQDFSGIESAIDASHQCRQ
jgi:hypothetical protein